MTSEQVATLVERLGNAITDIAQTNRRMETLVRDQVTWQQNHENSRLAWQAKHEQENSERFLSLEKWRVFVAGVAAGVTFLIGAGAAWVLFGILK